MAIDILNNCSFDSSKIKYLYVGSTLIDGSPINYPIEYTTYSGSSDSIISISSWDTINDIIVIGGQSIQLNKITNLGDNITFNEVLEIGSNGKTYAKTIVFTIPKITIFLINQLKEFTISQNGQVSLSPTLALLIDENDNQLVIGYDKALYLQNLVFELGIENMVTLTYRSSSHSRARNFIVI